MSLNGAEGAVVDWALSFLHHIVPLVILAVSLVVGGALYVTGATPQRRCDGALLALGPLLANRVTSVLKGMVERARPQHPEHGLEGLRVLIEDADRRSFPSGHVTTTVAFVIALFWALPPFRGRGLVTLLVPIMMWDRMALGVHFPSDTLAGVAVACLTMVTLGRLTRGRDLRVPVRWRPAGALVLILVVTAAWAGATRPVEPVSMEEWEDLSLSQTWDRLLLEPVVGPPLEVAWAPGARRVILLTLPWGVLGLLAIWRLTLRDLRVRVLSLCAGLAVIWGVLFWSGWPPPDRFHSRVEGIFFDPHVHGSDPVDGARDVHMVLDRKAGRGVDVVALTNHDAPPPVAGPLPGMEWSGGRHPEDTYLHLLVLGGRGALDAVSEVVVPELSRADARGRERGLEAVRVAKANGAVVIVAHHWRTLEAMERAGTAHHLPTPVELADAGADGFEVANRHWEADPLGRSRVEAIDALCRDRGLLRVASSDDHGIPAGSPCITFLPGRFPTDAAGRVEAVLERLRDRGEVWPVVWMRERKATLAPAVLTGPIAIGRYFAGLSLAGRCSWLVWFLVAMWWVRRGRPVTGRAGE